jgi:hypothetical protein
LRALFGRLIAAIGAPAIITTLTLAPRMRTTLARQIALIEILARKLLLAEAADLSTPTQRGPRVIEIALAASGLYTLPQTRRHAHGPARAQSIPPIPNPGVHALRSPSRAISASSVTTAPRVSAPSGATHRRRPPLNRRLAVVPQTPSVSLAAPKRCAACSTILRRTCSASRAAAALASLARAMS